MDTGDQRDRIAAMDARLVALARSAGALRLAVGDGLDQLRRTAGHLELGFSSLGAYSLERLGRRRRWAEESARVAERLAELPRLRAALARGELGWAMVELLARHATPETESRLVGEAQTKTVRAMRESLATVTPDREERSEDERRTLRVGADKLTSWAWEMTRSLVRMRFGAADDDAVAEALLAEGMTTLLARHPELACRLDASDRAAAWDQRRDLERRYAEVLAEDAFGGGRDPGISTLVEPLGDAGEIPHEPHALDRHLRASIQRLQTRDRRLGEVASAFWAAGGWRALGYASASQYANERLGCSLASLKARMSLVRRCRALPEVGLALDSGDLGFEAARLVARVADRETVLDWVERAAARTVVHLREEVDVVEAIARAEGGDAVGAKPPTEALVSEFHDLERGMLDGSLAELLAHGGSVSGQMSDLDSGDGVDPGQVDDAADDEGPGQMSVDDAAGGEGPGQVSVDDAVSSRFLGKAPLRLRLTSDVAAFWRDVRRLFDASGEAGDFVDFLIRAFWRVWLRPDPDQVVYHDVYERERYRCVSPICSNRDLTPHHLLFRIRGGGEGRDNICGLCVTCHLELLHLGRMTAAPPADDISWTFGRTPLMRVNGRTLVRDTLRRGRPAATGG